MRSSRYHSILYERREVLLFELWYPFEFGTQRKKESKNQTHFKVKINN